MIKYNKLPKSFKNSKGEDDKRPIFEELGCKVDDHFQGILVDDYYVVSLKSNRWKRLDTNKWYPYKNIKDLVARYFRPNTYLQCKLTKAILKRWGWVKLEPLRYFKDGVLVIGHQDINGWFEYFYTESGGTFKKLMNIHDLREVYESVNGRELKLPEVTYFRGYIPKENNN